jgi:hypothetical protein
VLPSLGKRPFIWYHFLSTEGAAAQVAHTKACVGDLALPGMLDVEPEGDRKATLAQVLAYADEAKAAGLRLRLVYLPRWYWQELGSPSLSGLAARGLALVSSSYPGGAGSAPALYPGDKASGWNAYGGVTPALYQYTNQAADGGRTMDYNAFRGTAAQLAAALQTPSPAPAPTPAPSPTPSSDPEDDDMPALAIGEIKAGPGATTVIAVPPANFGSAGWGDVWFSLAAAFGDAHVEVSVYTHGPGWNHVSKTFLVPDSGDRANPCGGPLPTAVQKIAVKRGTGPDCNVPLSYLIEATHR